MRDHGRETATQNSGGFSMHFPATITRALALGFIATLTVSAAGQDAQRQLKLAKQHETPVITVQSAGAEGIKIGFEGGRVIKLKGQYHLFTSEMMDEHIGVKMRLGHWASADRIHWRRIATLYESSGNYTGQDPRAALWAPMPVYNDRESLWNLFYVAYRCAPSTAEKWLDGHEGKIWRAVSKVGGPNGIGGPYEDVGIILQPGAESQPWEGLQGTDSFFPFKAGVTWYGFYGSADTQKIPVQAWKVGLASAPQLAGPWKRFPDGNPLTIEKTFIENPVVTELSDGTFVAVYDNPVPNTIGYSFSRDGVHWEPGRELIVQPKGKGHWAHDIRTPLGLIHESGDLFTLFYTGLYQVAAQPGKTGDYAVGFVTVKLAQFEPGKSQQ
jgi:hypothetical protein